MTISYDDNFFFSAGALSAGALSAGTLSAGALSLLLSIAFLFS